LDTEAGLIVPVIRDVDKKNLVVLSRELEELAKKARERKFPLKSSPAQFYHLQSRGIAVLISLPSSTNQNSPSSASARALKPVVKNTPSSRA